MKSRTKVILVLSLVLILVLIPVYLFVKSNQTEVEVPDSYSSGSNNSSGSASTSDIFNITDNTGIIDDPTINMQSLSQNLTDYYSKYVDATYEYQDSDDSIKVTLTSGTVYSIKHDSETKTLSIYKESGAILNEMDLSDDTDLRSVCMFITEELSNV